LVKMIERYRQMWWTGKWMGAAGVLFLLAHIKIVPTLEMYLKCWYLLYKGKILR
jgi:hypothetical protein